MAFVIRPFFRLRKLFKKFFYHSGLVALFSLIWFLARTGTKPTRAIYPCQQVARNNLAIFGLPALAVFSRRLRKSSRFLQKMAVVSIALVLATAGGFWGIKRANQYRFGLVKQISGQAGSAKVVWVDHSQATTGTYQSHPWPDKANQSTVNLMMDEAIMALTETNSVAEAWTAIFSQHNGGPDYAPGEKIVIKANFNNNFTGSNCDSSGCPVPQVAVALARQLVEEKGISQNNVIFYDGTRDFAAYYSNYLSNLYPGVQLNPNRIQTSNVSAGLAGVYFRQSLADTKYLINMPLLRTHVRAGVTLSFKNHLGSVGPYDTGCAAGAPSCPGPYSFHGGFFTNSADNSLVILNRQPTIQDKTILVIGEALFAKITSGPYGVPELTPNSLFVSTDPVAADSVMIDYLESVGATIYQVNNNNPRTYLGVAASQGLGNYATSCSGGNCSFDYTGSGIELIRCQEGVCQEAQPTPTPAPYLSLSSGWNEVFWSVGLPLLTAQTALENLDSSCGAGTGLAVAKKTGNFWQDYLAVYGGKNFNLNPGETYYFKLSRPCLWNQSPTFFPTPTPQAQTGSIGLSFSYSPQTIEFFPYLTNEKDYVDMRGANLGAIQEAHNVSVRVNCVSISLGEMEEVVAKLQANEMKCDYLAYNAEDRANATPYEEMYPYENYVVSVQTAQQTAHNGEAIFVNGPGLSYMESQDDRGESLYKAVAPYVDIWMIQSQGYTTVGQTDEHATPDQYREAVSQVVDWIHTTNPEAKIWVQVILSSGRLATNPLSAEEVVAYAQAVEDIVDNMRIYLRDSEGNLSSENLEKLEQIIISLSG